MDIYVLDESFRRVDIVDEYVSMIWTERYSDIGDFKLSTLATSKYNSVLRLGRYLSIPGSDRVQLIESAEEANKDGLELFNVSGRTPECLLEDRVTLSEDEYYIQKSVGSIIVSVMTAAVGDSSTPEYNPKILIGPSPGGDLFDFDVPSSELLSVIKGLADIGGVGIRMTPSDTNLRFTAYIGSKRGNLQFSVQTDTLTDTSRLRSIKDYKNIARVRYRTADGKTAYTYVAAPGFDNNVRGFDRKVMNVDATSINRPSLEQGYLTSMFRTKALIELSKHQKTNLYTGTVNPNTALVYNRDYSLGDIGVAISEDGVKQDVRVTEYIFASDQEGDRDYPTFSLV